MNLQNMQIAKLLVTSCLLTPLALTGCNNDTRTQELVQAKLDAERLKQVTEENQQLKATVERLTKENQVLRQRLAKAEAATVATSGAKKPAGGKPTPAEKEELKEDVTGGTSFK